MKQIKFLMENEKMDRGAAIGAVMLSKIQDDYAKVIKINLGSEFRSSYECASSQNQNQNQNQNQINQNQNQKRCNIVLGDRPVQLTLLRTWESLNFFKKVKMFCFLAHDIFNKPSEEEIRKFMEKVMRDSDFLTESIAEMAKHFPTVAEVIISERDRYMLSKIHQTIDKLQPTTMVCVVGYGHLAGMFTELEQNADAYKDQPSYRAIIAQTSSTKKKKGDETYEDLLDNIVLVENGQCCLF